MKEFCSLNSTKLFLIYKKGLRINLKPNYLSYLLTPQADNPCAL